MVAGLLKPRGKRASFRMARSKVSGVNMRMYSRRCSSALSPRPLKWWPIWPLDALIHTRPDT